MSMQQNIIDRVLAGLSVTHLDVLNESSAHNVPAGSETHFKVVVVSPLFAGMPLLKRHQMIYGLLREPLAQGVHALALHAYTEAEWSARTAVPGSPPCRGGSERPSSDS